MPHQMATEPNEPAAAKVDQTPSGRTDPIKALDMVNKNVRQRTPPSSLKYNDTATNKSNVQKREPKAGTVGHLRYLLKNGELASEVAQVLDLDRIKESEEDFLLTDRRRQLAISWNKLRPLKDAKGVMCRTIVGDPVMFDAGKEQQDLKKRKTMTKKVSQIKKKGTLQSVVGVNSKEGSRTVMSTKSGLPSRKTTENNVSGRA